MKIPMAFFTEQRILKFVWNHSRPLIAKTIPRKNKQEVSHYLISNYYKAMVIKIVWPGIKTFT